MTKQEFIRKALLLGFEREFVLKAAEQISEHNFGFDGLLSGLSVALPRNDRRLQDRYCPAMRKSLRSDICRETIGLLGRRGGPEAQRCMSCSHSEWL